MKSNYDKLRNRFQSNWLSHIKGLGIDNPINVTREIASNYISGRIAATSASSAKTELNVLKAYYNKLIAEKDLDIKNPFSHIKINRRDSQNTRIAQALTREQARKFIELAKLTPYSTLLLMMLGLGLRISEAVNIDASDIFLDCETPFVVLHNTKTHKERQIALPDWLVKEIRDDCIKLEGKITDTCISTISRQCKEIFKKIGLEGQYSSHSLRATAITNLLNLGVPHRDVKIFSGHSSILMVEKYDRRRLTIKDSPALLNKY